MYLSIVTTLYHSASHLEEFYKRVTAEAEKITRDYEMIFVNDGSPDASLEVALALYRKDRRVKVVDLSRNFGHHKAIMTGLSYAKGELIFLIDCDLEEEPELLAPFFDTFNKNDCDLVYGVQRKRQGDFFRKLSGAIFYKIFNWLSAYPIPANVITARLMSRRFVLSLLQHKEREVFIDPLFTMTGYNQIPIFVTKHSHSKTTYTLGKKISLIVNGVTAFSNRPLIFMFYLGGGILLNAILATIYMIASGKAVGGWPLAVISIWTLGGLIIAGLALIGMYLFKALVEVKDRPYTIIRHFYEREADAERNGKDKQKSVGKAQYESRRDSI